MTIVIIDMVIDKRFRFSVFRAGSEFLTNEIPHVPEETLLWGIIPAVSVSVHGPAEIFIMKNLDQPMVRVMAEMTDAERFNVPLLPYPPAQVHPRTLPRLRS